LVKKKEKLEQEEIDRLRGLLPIGSLTDLEQTVLESLLKKGSSGRTVDETNTVKSLVNKWPW
jgi:hypothetical protein